MELRNCSVKHFIQTIRGQVVIKVCNINCNGSTVPETKTLKDIYDSEDAKRLQRSPSGSVVNNKQVKHKGLRFLMADRTLREVKSEPADDSTPSADSCSDSDLDDATTLTQLKNRLFTKKRMRVSADEKAVEDESDLNEPLIKLKTKHLKASRAKRRCLSPSVSSPATKVVIKYEEDLVFGGLQQAGGELAPLILVKTEVPDAEQLGSQKEISTASSAGHNEVPNSATNTVIPEYEREPLSNVKKYEDCLINEISYDHLAYVQTIFKPFPQNELSTGLESPLSGSEESLGSASEEIPEQNEISDSHSLVTSCSDNPNGDVSSPSSNSSVVEDMPDECSYDCLIPDPCLSSAPNTDVSCPYSSYSFVEDMPEDCSSGCQVPDMAIDGCITPPQESNCVLLEDKAEADLPFDLKHSLHSPDKNYSSNKESNTITSTKENPIFMTDNTADEKQPATSSFDTVLSNYSNTEEELLTTLDKQNSDYPVTSTENEYALEDKTCDNSDTVSKPEQHQLPERLFSTRKAFSPSSEEQLCLAMNSVEIWDDSDPNIDSECKGKLFDNQTEKKPSSLRSEVQYNKKTANPRLLGQVSQRKVTISTRRISKRSQIAKGNLEGPRFSRTLPNLSTGCTSIQGCSESAVAFSQRQMHDMESIAVKLMTELKSMKDIVEQKLLFEAYRNASLKNDADEVKSAINSAMKAEEMAKKWMSMMARDCNRFCKIMKMTPDSTSSPKDTLPKGERKIMFADEAGGKLCHVRLFYDNNASPASNDVEQ